MNRKELRERATILVEALSKLEVFETCMYYPPDGSKPFTLKGEIGGHRVEWMTMKHHILKTRLIEKVELALRLVEGEMEERKNE